MAEPAGRPNRRSVDSEAAPTGIVALRRALPGRRAEAADRWRLTAQTALDLTIIRDPDELMRFVLVAVRLLTNAAATAVLIPNPGSLEGYRVVQDDDDRGARLIRDLIGGDGLARLASPLSRGRLVIGAGPGVPGGHEIVAIRIEAQGQVHGTLVILDAEGGRGLDGEGEAMARTLAAQAAVSVDRARTHERALAAVRELDEANDALSRASQARSRLLANVAHELRTPLHSILLAARLLQEPAVGRLDRDRTLPVTIEEGGRHLLALLDDLVDLSRADIAELRLQVVDTDLAPLLGDVRRQVLPLAVAKDIRLVVAEAHGIRVAADPMRLRQVLLNLMSNAVQFTPPGGRVRVTATASVGVVHLRVRDTGPGIASEDLERAFVPFERLGRDDVPGAGLGLAISRRIVELHGGCLSATSVADAGSTFHATIPLATRVGAVRDIVLADRAPEPVPQPAGGLA